MYKQSGFIVHIDNKLYTIIKAPLYLYEHTWILSTISVLFMSRYELRTANLCSSKREGVGRRTSRMYCSLNNGHNHTLIIIHHTCITVAQYVLLCEYNANCGTNSIWKNDDDADASVRESKHNTLMLCSLLCLQALETKNRRLTCMLTAWMGSSIDNAIYLLSNSTPEARLAVKKLESLEQSFQKSFAG